MEERLANREAQNWLKCMIAAYTTRDVIAQLADLGFKAFYTQIRSDLSEQHGILEATICSSCSNSSKQCRLCSEIGNRIWENHRFKKANWKGPSWSNTDSTKWCSDFWELAKCYMPPTGYRDKPNANSTDFNGIITAIYNCTWMQCYFIDDLSKDSNICTTARQKVNELRHIQDTNIDDGDMISFFDCLLNLLNDPSHLNSFKPAVVARTYLKQIQQDRRPLSEQLKESMLKKIYEERKEEFRGKLIEFYTRAKQRVFVLPLREGLDKPIWDVYVQPKLSHVTMEKDGSQTKMENAVNQYKSLFYKDDKLNSRVFVQGEPGMGKTTFLSKLALDWCEAVSLQNPHYKATFSDAETLKKFQFLFQISLRVGRYQREVIEMITTQIIDVMYNDDKREDTVKLLQQILEQETCIITMDGLNEWVDPLNEYVLPLQTTHFHRECVSVITSRPWKIEDRRIKDYEINNLIEIEGVCDSEDLLKKIMHSLQIGNLNALNEFMKFVNERRLRHFLTSPLLQTVLVNMWMYKEAFSGSLCEINCIIIDVLFKRANARRGYFPKDNTFQCLSKTCYIQKQIDSFDALANAAYNFTFSSKKSLMFSRRELLHHMSEVQLELCLHAGVLTKRYSSVRANKDSQFAFVLKTVQEFLTAYHIAHSNEELIEHYFQTESKYDVLEMSETIMICLCGLDCKKADKLLNRLADDEFLNDINHGLSTYVKGFLGEKKGLAFQTENKTQGTLLKSTNNQLDYDTRCFALSVLFQRMIIAGYIEAKASGVKKICLNCKDFTFNTLLNESDSNTLKKLLMSNNSDVRSLIIESNVLQTSEILTVIQQSKHSLKRVKATVTPDICKALYDTSIQELHIIGQIDQSSFSCVLPFMSLLTFLEIADSFLSKYIVLPHTIQHISLSNCACTHAFLGRLLVNISSLKHDVRFDLHSVNVTDCKTHVFHSELLLSSDMNNVNLFLKDGNGNLYNMLRCTSIRTLYLLTADSASLASEILHTLKQLTQLYLMGTYMGRCDLNLTSSLQCISLLEGECSSEWLCSLLITLSSLDHHVECQLLNFVLQSSEETRVDESHTHVSDLRSEMLSRDLSNIEILVKTGSIELFEILRGTSIGSLGLITADCSSLASKIFHTLNKLTKLCLTVPYTDQFNIKIPASLQCIVVLKGECLLVWLRSLLIALSSLDHPVECQLWDVVLQAGKEIMFFSLLSRDLSNIEILVTTGSMELFEMLRFTSIGILDLRTAKCASLASNVLQTFNKLTKLYLCGTYTGRCNLKLPTSFQCLILLEGECSSEWLCSLLIKLSSLNHQVECELWDVVLQSSEETLEDELHTSVSYLRSKILSLDLSNIAILVKTGSMELFELFRYTSIGILDLRTAQCASLASEILQTLNNLSKLYLWGTYTGRCVLKMPASLQCIGLLECECSSEWLCSLLLTLSSLDHSVKCELWDVVLQSSEEAWGGISHKHVSDLRYAILLCNMSKIEIIVKHGSKEVFEVLRDTSLGTLGLRTAECASLASEIIHTLNNLSKLYLWGTYTGQCDLKLPASMQCVTVLKSKCSSEWLRSLLGSLSSFDHPVKCELWDVILQSSKEVYGKDSPIHVSEVRSEILSWEISNINLLDKNVNMELIEIVCDTNIGRLDMRTDYYVSQASTMLPTPSTLENLFLRGTLIGRGDSKRMAPMQSSERDCFGDDSHLQMTCDKGTVGPEYLPPGNKATFLTTGNSESWESVEYLEYQCDVRRLPAFSYSKSFIKAIEARCMKSLSDIGLIEHDFSILFANEAHVFIPRRQSLTQSLDTIAFEQCKISTTDILKKCFSAVKPCVWIVDYEQTHEVFNFFYKYNISNEIICLLILGGDAARQKLHTHHNVIIAHTSDDNIIDALDDLLERFAFWTVRALTHRIKEKYGEQETLSDNVNEALHDVYDYIRSAYENSAVPNDEWPDIPASNHKLPENVDDAVESVIKIPGVLCCIKKMQRLEIYIDTASVGVEEFRKQSVLQVLDRYNINNVLFTYGNLNRLFAAGSPICDGLGTLGGFAEKFSRNNDENIPKQVDCQVVYSRTQNPNLVALISKHVAMVSLLRQNTSKGCLKVSKKVIGYIKSKTLQTVAWLDIVPVDVLEDVQKDCVKQFKTKDGLLKFATLTDMKLCKGLPVHIWGAVSSPGLGYVSEIKDSDFKIDKNRYIILTSYNDGTKFCQPGDSGSIVCTSDRKGVTLHAIAMLIGEYIPMHTEEHITIEGKTLNTAAETTQLGTEKQNTPCREKEKIKNTTEHTSNIDSGVKSDDTHTSQTIEEHVLIQSVKYENKNETDTEEPINMDIENPQGMKINQSFITDEDASSDEVKTEVTDQQRQGEPVYLALKLKNAFEVFSQTFDSEFRLCQEKK